MVLESNKKKLFAKVFIHYTQGMIVNNFIKFFCLWKSGPSATCKSFILIESFMIEYNVVTDLVGPTTRWKHRLNGQKNILKYHSNWKTTLKSRPHWETQ